MRGEHAGWHLPGIFHAWSQIENHYHHRPHHHHGYCGLAQRWHAPADALLFHWFRRYAGAFRAHVREIHAYSVAIGERHGLVGAPCRLRSDHDFVMQEHEAEILDHDVVIADHDLVVGDHRGMVQRLRSMVADHALVVRDHRRKLGDHGRVVRDLEREVRDHDVVVADHDLVVGDHDVVVAGHVTCTGTLSVDFSTMSS